MASTALDEGAIIALAEGMAITTVPFDIDGTLVDSYYLHVEAWSRAFYKVGVQVDAWRIHRSIGMDSKKLLRSLLGEEPGVGDEAKPAPDIVALALERSKASASESDDRR